ncbi:hypothetical protein BC834DRAFT_154287 [Gloeopeniophorella convolvens]|nr:hypothetical protein BC834DRAFT_154287 [Gloeopeniophorella convolvens]
MRPTVRAIRARVASVHPKTLHAYMLAHLPTAPQDVLTVLATFFSALAAPALLHCVRCHTDYADAENSDRACHIGHDDNTMNTEWVGPGRTGEEYMATWGCCDQTVEGYEDPPDGWCFEGMHTTDRKRACFRADADSDDDMLVSCDELKCLNIPTHPRRASGGAKRVRAPPVEDNTDDDDTGSEGTDVVKIVPSAASLRNKAKAKGKGKARVAKRRAPARQAESNAESSKTGGVGAPAPAQSAPKQHSNTKPRSTGGRARKTAAVTVHPAASPPPGSLHPGGSRPRSVATTDPGEPVLRATRSRGRGGGETADGKTTTDVEGGGRKRRKIASSAA